MFRQKSLEYKVEAKKFKTMKKTSLKYHKYLTGFILKDRRLEFEKYKLSLHRSLLLENRIEIRDDVA